MRIVLIVALATLAVLCVPFLVIWALNVLFGLGIAVTLKTWAAALILASLVGGSTVKDRSAEWFARWATR